MSSWSGGVTDNLRWGMRRMGCRETTLSVTAIQGPRPWLITSSFCIKTLIYIPDYIFYETVRSIRAERTEIMRGKHFNRTRWVCMTSVAERKGFFCGDGSFILLLNEKQKDETDELLLPICL